MKQRDSTTRCRAKGLWTGRGRYVCHPSRHRAGDAGASQAPPSLAGYKPEVRLLRVKAPVERSGLKPYWGKPAVRNFRGGAGNVRHGLMPICHQARKGGYSGRHWPAPWRACSPLDSRSKSRIRIGWRGAGLAMGGGTSVDFRPAGWMVLAGWRWRMGRNG